MRTLCVCDARKRAKNGNKTERENETRMKERSKGWPRKRQLDKWWTSNRQVSCEFLGASVSADLSFKESICALECLDCQQQCETVAFYTLALILNILLYSIHTHAHTQFFQLNAFLCAIKFIYFHFRTHRPGERSCNVKALNNTVA